MMILEAGFGHDLAPMILPKNDLDGQNTVLLNLWEQRQNLGLVFRNRFHLV